ncbi:hypothetical protein JT359_03670 [Candidatus Poribacteria bacterium]|nr:hypothetical protein [Candidatus Poribacteria bacterium]
MNNEQHQARIDGETDAETDVTKILWIVVGFFASLIGILIAYIYQPSPPASRLVEKSQEYVMFYTEAYKNKSRSVQVTNALIGLGIAFAVGIISFIAMMGLIGSMSTMR